MASIFIDITFLQLLNLYLIKLKPLLPSTLWSIAALFINVTKLNLFS